MHSFGLGKGVMGCIYERERERMNLGEQVRADARASPRLELSVPAAKASQGLRQRSS